MKESKEEKLPAQMKEFVKNKHMTIFSRKVASRDFKEYAQTLGQIISLFFFLIKLYFQFVKLKSLAQFLISYKWFEFTFCLGGAS